MINNIFHTQHMRKMLWIGMLAWAIIVSSYAVGIMNPLNLSADTLANEDRIRTGIFLLVCGLLIGAVGVIGFLHQAKKS